MCIFISVKIQALFSHTLAALKICFAAIGAMYFSCVASAAHFLFYGGIIMSFSENFKKARRNSGLSQQQLADLLGMNQSSVSKYENDIGLPHAKKLQKICEIFGVTIDSLLK